MTLSVIIVTLNRADCVLKCLNCLAEQIPVPEQVIVVDASSGDETKEVVAGFPDVMYIRTDVGYGHMTASRNLGLRQATGEIIAFIDDDSFAHARWSKEIRIPYADPAVGAVGGRALNVGQPIPTDTNLPIGRLLPNGRLTGNFAVDTGAVIETDHIIGCNMSYRRSVLAELGGLREDYPGTEVREETDICLRVRQLGYKILFTPTACLDHLGAPQAKGKRFDTRYEFFSENNHMTLLVRNYGVMAPIVWRYIAYSIANRLSEFAHRIGAAFARIGVSFIGTFCGIGTGIRLLAASGRSPVRRDAKGKELSEWLSVKEPHNGKLG